MRKHKPATNPFASPEMRPACSICGWGTGHLYKGVRYCGDHHPNPGEHIKPRTQPEAA